MSKIVSRVAQTLLLSTALTSAVIASDVQDDSFGKKKLALTGDVFVPKAQQLAVNAPAPAAPKAEPVKTTVKLKKTKQKAKLGKLPAPPVLIIKPAAPLVQKPEIKPAPAVEANFFGPIFAAKTVPTRIADKLLLEVDDLKGQGFKLGPLVRPIHPADPLKNQLERNKVIFSEILGEKFVKTPPEDLDGFLKRLDKILVPITDSNVLRLARAFRHQTIPIDNYYNGDGQPHTKNQLGDYVCQHVIAHRLPAVESDLLSKESNISDTKRAYYRDWMSSALNDLSQTNFHNLNFASRTNWNGSSQPDDTLELLLPPYHFNEPDTDPNYIVKINGMTYEQIPQQIIRLLQQSLIYNLKNPTPMVRTLEFMTVDMLSDRFLGPNPSPIKMFGQKNSQSMTKLFDNIHPNAIKALWCHYINANLADYCEPVPNKQYDILQWFDQNLDVAEDVAKQGIKKLLTNTDRQIESILLNNVNSFTLLMSYVLRVYPNEIKNSFEFYIGNYKNKSVIDLINYLR